MDHLAEWEASPFGDDLKADLALLLERKQEEHIQRFDKLREECRDYFHPILFATVLRTAQKKWTEKDGPWHLYLERELREFLLFDGKRTNRFNKRREKRRRGAKILGESVQDDCLINRVDIWQFAHVCTMPVFDWVWTWQVISEGSKPPRRSLSEAAPLSAAPRGSW